MNPTPDDIRTVLEFAQAGALPKTYDLFQTSCGSQTGDGEMREVENGDWIKAEDYTELRDELESVKRERDQHFSALQFNREILSKTAEILNIQDSHLDWFCQHVQEGIDRLKNDSDRLNWMDEHAGMAQQMVPASGRYWYLTFHFDHTHGKTLRVAIDNAMKKEASDAQV